MRGIYKDLAPQNLAFVRRSARLLGSVRGTRAASRVEFWKMFLAVIQLSRASPMHVESLVERGA